jgi:GTP cyclohydrolase I
MDSGSDTTTTALGGAFKSNTDTRKEFLLGL